MSDISRLGDREMDRQLFPDTGYGFNSGGDPEAIPDLSWEKFTETYRRHYHPSNAWIFLDGAVPMEEMLALIASYLDICERAEDLPRFRLQAPVSSVREKEYELGQEEEAENRGHLYLARILGSWQDKTQNMAYSVLTDVMTGNNDAPLKRKILERNLAQDFSVSVDDSSLQAVLSIHAENVTDGREQEILDAIAEYAAELERDGLNREDVEASLNRFAFSLKEEDEPQGVERAIRIMGSWLYDGDPMFLLENDEEIGEMRRMLASGEMDRLAVSLLKDQEGMCRLTLRPSKTLGEEKRRAEEARLHKITSEWDETQKKANAEKLASLQAWQETPDSPEALATLPMLKKEDADIPPAWPETELLREEDVPLLFHAQPTAGIVYLRGYFAVTELTLGELQDLSLIGALLGKLPTANYDSARLQQEIKRVTGRMAVTVNSRIRHDHPEICSPCMMAGVSALKENAEKAQELLAEVLRTTDFSCTEKIMEIVNQLELISRQRIVGAGHTIALRHVLSHFSADGAVKNALEGDGAVAYLHAFATDPERMLPRLRATAEKMKSRLTDRGHLTLSVTAEEKVSCAPLLRWLPKGEAAPETAAYAAEGAFSQGYRIPAQVGYAARGWHLSKMGQPFHGSLLLLANILSLSYLWNRVRVLGGAYGCGFHADRFGNLFSYSYRDPTPGRTLGMDAGASAFLREFLQGDESLDKYIISTLNDLNPLLGPREKGGVADSRYFSGYTLAEAEQIRKEILHATPEDLEKAAALLDAFAANGAVCVVAPGELLEKCGDLPVEDL